METLGFHSLDREVVTELPVEGEVPSWLSGSLVRNGPGTFRTADGEVDHWFDGFAMLRKFTFADGAVHYQNRFLRTDAYADARAGTFDAGFATGGAGLVDRLRSFLFEAPYDNANVIAEPVGGEYVALTETPRWVRFDPGTLETLGHTGTPGGEAPGTDGANVPRGNIACAHLHHDPWTGDVVTFETEFGRTSQYHVHELRGPDERRHVASLPTDEPSYMHSFAVTRNYVVLTEVPFVMDPMDFLRPGEQSFVDAFRWDPDRGTRFVVVDRERGGVVADPVVEPFFAFHHVNAYETDGDRLVVNVETVPDAESIAALSLDRLRSGDLGVFGGKLDRFTVDLRADGATVDREELYEGGTGLPTVSPAVAMREHRYVYAQGADQPVTEWPAAVVKVDTETGAVREYEREGCYASEPVFVPRPPEGDDGTADPGPVDESPVWRVGRDGPEREDAGVVLTVLLDTEREHSWLAVLDGETLEERALAAVPHALPFDFHGRFLPGLTT